MTLAFGTQSSDVAAAIAPEPETFADHDSLRSQCPNQHAFDKNPGVPVGERCAESQDPQFRDARLRNSFGLVPKPHQPSRRLCRHTREILARMRLEADDGRRQPQLEAALPQNREDRLVSEVNAVKVADCNGVSAVRVPAGFETTSKQQGPAGSGIVPRDYRGFRCRGRAPEIQSMPK